MRLPRLRAETLTFTKRTDEGTTACRHAPCPAFSGTRKNRTGKGIYSLNRNLGLVLSSFRYLKCKRFCFSDFTQQLHLGYYFWGITIYFCSVFDLNQGKTHLFVLDCMYMWCWEARQEWSEPNLKKSITL
jgi:hypothetical protein